MGVLVVALVAVVVLALSGGLLWAYAWARLGGEELPSLSAQGDDALGAGGATSPAGATTVLVALTAAGDDTGSVDGPLAGPLAVVQVGGPRGDDAAVLLLPTELPVSVDGEAPTTLSQTLVGGGPDGLLRAVVDYTQIAIDHVVTASTEALPDLVGALGPVEICSPSCRVVDEDAVSASVATFTDTGAAPAELAAALQELAVVVRGVATEVGRWDAVTSPLASKRAIDVVAGDVTTDVSLRGAALLPLADRLATAGDVAVVQLPSVVNPDSGRLLVLPEQAATRFAVLREGGVPTTTPADDEASLLGDAVVAIHNGTGTAGYAAALEAQLAALGVRIAGTGNAPSFDVDRTLVAYGRDDAVAEAAAVLVARELGDVDLVALERQPTFEGEPVTVLVTGGADLDTDRES